MKLLSNKNGIIHLEFPNRKEICMTMGRPQEFYESGHKHLRNKYFTVDEFLDTFMDDDGNVNYYNKWSGFNIPGSVLLKFFRIFGDDITEREDRLGTYVYHYDTQDNPKFYVIATMKGDSDTIDHEIAHAMHHMSASYRKRSKDLTEALDSKTRNVLNETLLEMGYAKHVLLDEINAYMSTSSPAYMKKRFGLGKESKVQMKPFRDLFAEYRKKLDV